MYIYRVSNVYLSYIFRVCIEIYSGLQAAKVLLFCDICKKKMHFYAKLIINQKEKGRIDSKVFKEIKE